MILKKLRELSSNQLVRNFSWLAGAELVNRFFRLGTTVVLARVFNPYDYGMVAIIYTTFDIVSVFSLKAGIGAKIVQARKQDLQDICDTSYWLNWILCVALFIIQCIAAFPIAQLYRNDRLILPICAVSLIYLMLPFFMVQAALIQRENRLKVIALGNAIASIATNLIIVCLSLLGMGIWAIVLSMLIPFLALIAIYVRSHPWQPPKSFKIDRWREVTNFGKNMLGIDLLDKIRSNIDYLLVGHFFGVDALGLYFFAFNAGLGISLTIMSSFVSALFPHLCAARGDFKRFKKQYLSSLKTIFLAIVPLILIQACLAPFYVPIVFGHKWIPAIPILVIICLSALPRPFAKAAALLLDALDKTHISLYFDVIFTVIFTFSLLMAVKWGVLWVAVAVLVSHLLLLPIFTIWASQYVFNKRSRFQFQEASHE